MAKFRFKPPGDIMKEIQRQARGKRVPAKCPHCGTTNHFDAGDILKGGKEVKCVGCELVFRMKGTK